MFSVFRIVIEFPLSFVFFDYIIWIILW